MNLKRQPLASDMVEVPIRPRPVAAGTERGGGGSGGGFPTGRGVLSAAEIEALLRPDIPEDAFEAPETVSAKPVPDFEDSENDARLDGEAGALAAQMTLALRKHCGIQAVLGLKSAAYVPLSQLVAAHRASSVLILFRDKTGLQNAGLSLDHELASALIAVSCGGQAAGHKSRPLSALDRRILEHMLAPLAKAIDPTFEIATVETERSAAFAILPPGKAMLTDLSCQLGMVMGRMIFARVQARHAAPASDYATRETEPSRPPVSAVITARIARISVPLSRLSNLKPGSVMRLGLPVDQPVELLSGGRDGQVIAEGDIGRKGKRIAVRVNKCSPALKG